MFIVLLILPSSFLADSQISASEVLKTFEKRFLGIVNAKQSLHRLKHCNVISEEVKKKIEEACDDDAKYILYEHLEKNATVDTLREYCEAAIAADGYPKMKNLGDDMLEMLSPKGWLE